MLMIAEEALTKMREEQIAKKQKPKYNGFNRDAYIEFTEGMVLRFKFLKDLLNLKT